MANRTYNVTCVGDSLTNSTGISGNEPPEWPARVTLGAANMLNYAVGGTKIEDATARLVSHAFPQDPVLCICWTGTNNVFYGDDLETIKTKYKKMLGTLSGRNSVHATACPRGLETARDDIRLSFNDWLRSLPGLQLIDMAPLFVHPDSSRHMNTELSFDGVHLNALGKIRAMEQFAPYIAQVVGYNPIPS